MDALLSLVKGHPLVAVLLWALLFRAVDQVLQKLPVPRVVQQDPFRAWRWRNLSVSMVHSVISGTWAVTSSLVWPETLKDLHLHHSPQSLLLVSISTGYFVQDACDIILSGFAKGSWEFLLHHALVLGCFLYSLCTQVYVAGAVVALFVEVNSVTLHLRLLLKLAGAQATPLYRVNKVTNVATYAAFRLLTQFYLTWYIVRRWAQLDSPAFFLFCMTLMNIMILVYFYRLLRADFCGDRRRGADRNGLNNNSRKFLSD